MPQVKENSTQQELLALLGENKKRRTPRKRIIAAALAILTISGAAFFWHIKNNSGESQGQVSYRQYTVLRGDVTVGTSESPSISLDREVISFPVSSSVEKIFVKEGQSVKKGDPLMQLNVEEITDGMVSCRMQVQMAELELERARLNRQTKLLKAGQEYASAVPPGISIDIHIHTV